MKKLFTLTLLLSLPLLFAGCPDKGKLSGLAPCAGTLTMDGQPIAEANIVFSPTGGGTDMRAAAAKTDAQGKFTMTTLTANDGVTPGDFAITVIKYESYGPELPPVKDEETGEMVPAPRPIRNILPEKYASLTTSNLKFTIPNQGNKNLEIVLEK